jgi:iron complex transport system substrate-binding protein
MRGVRGPLAVALIALAALSGCAVHEKNENASSLKVAHAAGETRVPARADRVVALSPDSLDTALALGVRPVAATFADGHFPTYLASRVRGVEKAGTYEKPFFNAIDFVGPDLIMGEKDLQRRYYGRLAKIASTVMSADRGNSFEVNTRLFGEAMARTDQAEKLLSQYDRVTAGVRKRLASVRGRRVSIVRVLPDGIQPAGARSFAGVIVGQAGFGRPRSQQVEKDAAKLNTFKSIEGDVILYSVAPGAERTAARVVRSPAWRGLRAVRAGRVHRVADDPWRTGGGVLGAEQAQRDLARLLAP